MKMNMTQKAIAALCTLAVAGCAADRGSSSSDSGMSSSSYPSSSSGAQSGTSTSSTAQTSYGVVQAIDQMQRQDVGVGAVGAAAAGGSAGLPTDKVYRVTVRMDDGASQMVVVDSMPSYKIGDRVRYNNGMLSSYQ
jgi:lipoprotein-anchoring transpeptidase ErfK/SrfK